MTRDEAVRVMPGDILNVTPLHDLSEPKRRRHLGLRTTVINKTIHANSGTGVTFLVKTLKGGKIWVDASYFEA